MKQKNLFILLLLLLSVGCNSSNTLVKIQNCENITKEDIPEYAFYYEKDDFYLFLDSIVNRKIILHKANDLGLENELLINFEDIKRIMILDKLWISLQDSFINNQDSLAYLYWLSTQKSFRLFVLRFPIGDSISAIETKENIELYIKSDTSFVKEIVNNHSLNYKLEYPYEGINGDLRWTTGSILPENLCRVVLNLPDFSVSEPVVTDTGVFLLVKYESKDLTSPGEFEELKELILLDMRNEFIFDQSDNYISKLRNAASIEFNKNALEIFSTLLHFKRVSIEEPVVISIYNDSIEDIWLFKIKDRNILIGELFNHLKTGRYLYPDLSDTNLLKLFIIRDYIPPILLSLDGESRGIFDELMSENYNRIRDSLTVDYFINSKLAVNIDSIEVFFFYENNPEIFIIPERINLRIIGVKDSILANSLIDSIKISEDFDIFARKYSELPSSLSGGDLGLINRGRYDNYFDSLIFLNYKEDIFLSDIIYRDSFYIIYQTSGYKEESLLPFDLSYDRAKAFYKKTLRENLRIILLENFKKEYNVEYDSIYIGSILKSEI